MCPHERIPDHSSGFQQTMTRSTPDRTARISADFRDLCSRTENPDVGGSRRHQECASIARAYASFQAVGLMRYKAASLFDAGKRHATFFLRKGVIHES